LKILFDHLQKTGGTALLDFLRRRLGDRKVSPLILHEDIRFAANVLGNFAIVGGHLELARDYNWNNGVYHLTLLRDPVERFLSHYSYAREQPDAADPFAVLARRHDVATLLRLGDEDVVRTATDFYIRHFAVAFDAPVPATPAALFATIAQRYQLIGISERMDDVARILCLLLGRTTGHVAPVRVTGTRLQQADVDPDTLARLRALTAGDRTLYQLAATRFASVVRALGTEPSEDRELTKSNRKPRKPDVHPGPDPPPGSPRVVAAELSCPASDTNDCALTGADCVLALRIDPGDAPPDPRIALQIANGFHQVIYRENRRLEHRADDCGPIEVLWRFVCPLGAGLYRCSVTIGLIKLADVYEFTVVQPPLSPWAGLVDLRPSVEVIERPDANAKGLAGSVTPTTATLTGGPASVVLLRAAIRNEGTREWRPDGITRVVVSYRLFNDETVCIVEDGLRTMLPNRMGRAKQARSRCGSGRPRRPAGMSSR
jgi:hypothetical protein